MALAFQDDDSWSATMDVDVIVPRIEVASLDANDSFWQALEKTNQQLESEQLYLTHIFVEEQVILSPNWASRRVSIPSENYTHIVLQRPSIHDLILTKMMRVDPEDRADVKSLYQKVDSHNFNWNLWFQTAHVPDILELKEAFDQNCNWFLKEVAAKDIDE